ncbi:MAG TPA: AAA family ATPase [Fimbriimonadales bacterium]|nr:AAA family ATPase [Fimbriimonadales bacterium]
MAIRKIRISNFKSFENIEVELGDFNILIGANASGKSNFIQVFRFLMDIPTHKLDNAISMQGGVEYLRNINIGSSKCLSLEIVSDNKFARYGRVLKTKAKEPMGMEVYETIYKFAIKFNKRGSGYEINEDKLTQRINIVKFKIHKKKIEERKKIGQGEMVFSNIKGRLNTDLKLQEGLPIEKDDIIPRFLRDFKFGHKNLAYRTSLHFLTSF